MGFPEDLLQLANEPLLADEPNQASLRRAVSTAYYALFHLLIDEAVSIWPVERHRSDLARTFEHGRMKKVCEDLVRRVNRGANLPVELSTVAQSFIELQHHRHTADYDNSRQWSVLDVSIVWLQAEDAFVAWRAICDQDAAQDFLLQLFLPKLPRQ
jgi:uncharacterized protein (UPF0332 family)